MVQVNLEISDLLVIILGEEMNFDDIFYYFFIYSFTYLFLTLMIAFCYFNLFVFIELTFVG